MAPAQRIFQILIPLLVLRTSSLSSPVEPFVDLCLRLSSLRCLSRCASRGGGSLAWYPNGGARRRSSRLGWTVGALELFLDLGDGQIVFLPLFFVELVLLLAVLVPFSTALRLRWARWRCGQRWPVVPPTGSGAHGPLSSCLG